MTFLVFFVFVLASFHSIYARPGVADPVKPCYDHSQFHTFFDKPQVPDDLTDLQAYATHGGVGLHKLVCMSNTHQSGHNVNRLFGGYDLGDIEHHPYFLPGTTYWFNEFLHVGHVHYDIDLIQVLSMARVDRIVLQRAVCVASLCRGMGTMESFYKGYFTALLEAFNQSHVPIYVRYYSTDQEYTPLYFSSKSPTFYVPAAPTTTTAALQNNSSEARRFRPLAVHRGNCFETLIRRADYYYGGVPTVSKRAVQRFKASAYSMLRNNNHTSTLPALTTHFSSLDPPFRILFSFRGSHAPSRHIGNIELFTSLLQKHFASPTYELRVFDNSDPAWDFEAQLHAVASAHVVLTTHGAFEGNMIYMKNSSLLIEIFGDYGNNEIHTFHRLALMFGVYYARVQPRNNTDHLASSFILHDDEMLEIVSIIEDYFQQKHFRHNVLMV